MNGTTKSRLFQFFRPCSIAAKFCVTETTHDVIVHHSCGLHEGVADGGASEMEVRAGISFGDFQRLIFGAPSTNV
jgi:hypothetical protein